MSAGAMTDEEKTAKIRKLNDDLRKFGPGPWNKLFLTHMMSQTPMPLRLKVFSAVQSFNDFNEDNDPYGEHDCAIMDVKDADGTVHRIFFKIDYYDTDLRYGSEAPWNERMCRRVLTIGFAEEM